MRNKSEIKKTKWSIYWWISLQHLYLNQFLRCSAAAKIHLAGHIQPAGRVFETPVLD